VQEAKKPRKFLIKAKIKTLEPTISVAQPMNRSVQKGKTNRCWEGQDTARDGIQMIYKTSGRRLAKY